MANQERVPWESLCNCVAIDLPAQLAEKWHTFSFEKSQEKMKKLYLSGADYTFNADCECCDGTGDSRNVTHGN